MSMLNRLPPDTKDPADQDDHHTIAIDIIGGDNHYPARALHPYPFAATFATSSTWPSWFGSAPTVTYSFITADTEAGLADVSDHRPLVSDAFDTWATYTNIHFQETHPRLAQVNVFGFQNESASERIRLGYATIPNPKYEFFPPTSNIALNVEYLHNAPEARMTALHEIGHAVFGLQHPFEAFLFPDPRMNLTSFSIMNYDHEITVKHKAIIPFTPMPYDIEAAQRQYGVKPHNIGDNTYLLQELLPDNYPRHLKPIASLPYDHSGSDTISAAGLKGYVTIDLRHYGRSTLPQGFIAMPRMDIEHVVGGEGTNTIILNPLDNGVDVRAAKGTTRIVIDPKQTGHDTIFGFNPAKDRLVIKSDHDDFLPRQRHGTHESDCVVISNKSICHQGGTVIMFDKDNTILLADVKAGDIHDTHFTPSREEVIQEHEIALLAEFSHYPKEFFNDFSTALTQGSAWTFVSTLNEEYMRAMGCSATHIARAGFVINALMALYTGSVITSSAALMTSNIISYLGFSSQTANIASTVVATGLNAAKNFSIIGAARMATAMVGSYAGSRFTLWARDKAKQKWRERKEALQAAADKKDLQPHQMV